MAGGSFETIHLVIVAFAVAAAILWFLLPFAIFGTKTRLDAILAEARQTNAYLKLLIEQKSQPRGS